MVTRKLPALGQVIFTLCPREGPRCQGSWAPQPWFHPHTGGQWCLFSGSPCPRFLEGQKNRPELSKGPV